MRLDRVLRSHHRRCLSRTRSRTAPGARCCTNSTPTLQSLLNPDIAAVSNSRCYGS